MHQKKSRIYRILSVWIAFSFLSVLFFITPVQEQETHSSHCFQQEQSIPHPEFSRFVILLCKEEFLPQKTINIYRRHMPENLKQSGMFQMCFTGGLWLTAVMRVLAVSLRMAERIIFYSQKYIIRYIQNQDGRKGWFSV